MSLLSLPQVRALPPDHVEALRWFDEHQGLEVSWPAQMSSGMFLVNKAKGIHKPAGSEYALSIRQSLNGPYADREPIVNSDGSWIFQYFQEQADPLKRDSMYTNIALLACQRDAIPIGVVRKVKDKPSSRYKVLGLALVKQWENGYFLLEGAPSGDVSSTSRVSLDNREELQLDSFDPENIEDARLRIQTAIVRRQGQKKFRNDVLSAYNNSCAITGCDVVEAIEAAHIYPYLGQQTNIVTNGLPLRSDLHTLYDLGLITIRAASMTVLIRPTLLGSMYGSFANTVIRPPRAKEHQPNRVALNLHLEWAIKKWDT
ncbi:HNH endonuclease [Pseudoduganella sp. FT55W]|uniref:HNH endonuclease n=2 Tax=Duganella rivi TaxID=2666083 RepID=A0A7X4GVA6_9BURK|nr:HNH endonuclease [Duganella rivi]